MLLDDDDAMEFIRQKMAEAEPSQRLLPVWGYILLFVGPGTLSFVALYVYMGLNLIFSGVIALAIMNGSINSMIAWLTIRLDGHSTDALDHLELIMSEMEKFDQTLNSANEKIESFTTDLDIMGFIQKGNSKSGMMKQTVSMPKLPKFPTPQPIAEPTISDILEGIGAEDDGWGDDDDFFTPAKTKLTLKRPKPPLTLKRPRNS
jgi:hypothetical protein